MTSRSSIPPLVSVIVPTYNRAYCLGRTIQSVLDQTYMNWELVIVDNYSTDDTDKLIASFSDLRIELHKIHNEGVIAASRNKGIKAAKGKYVAFLDSDDWWHPSKLELAVQRLEMGADIVYHDLYIISSPSAKPWLWKRSKTRLTVSPVFKDLLFNGNALNNSSVVVKRDLMDQIDGFSEDPLLIAAEDYDAWLRLAKRTNAFSRLDKTLGFYWAGGGNMSSPTRTITSLNKLRELYAAELMECGDDVLPAWMSYSLARAYLCEGQFEQSRQYSIKAISRTENVMIYCKSLATRLVASWKLI